MRRGFILTTPTTLLNDLENDPRYHLSAEEEKVWKALKHQPNTKEDWLDLHAAIIAYKRRFIKRHTIPKAKCGAHHEGECNLGCI